MEGEGRKVEEEGGCESTRLEVMPTAWVRTSCETRGAEILDEMCALFHRYLRGGAPPPIRRPISGARRLFQSARLAR